MGNDTGNVGPGRGEWVPLTAGMTAILETISDGVLEPAGISDTETGDTGNRFSAIYRATCINEPTSSVTPLGGRLSLGSLSLSVDVPLGISYPTRLFCRRIVD